MPTQQQPIGSGFGPASTAAEVIAGQDLTGKVALVTGGYSGIGLETARTLAAAGATVIVPARNREKAEANLGSSKLELESLDLMDPDSIDSLAERFLASGRPLHLLINNAGIMAAPLQRDSRGNESQFSTNHLGHFQLTARLWPALLRAEGARVVALSSLAHAGGSVDLDDPNYEQRAYEPWAAYAQAKTANALFALELDRRGEPQGVRAFSVHPGAIITDLGRFTTNEHLRAYGMLDENHQPIIDPATGRKTVEQGAATTVWCATSPQLSGKGGVYCENCDIAVPVPAEAEGAGVRPWATDPALASRLWTLTERLTGATLS
jgi:NAD(P)-dependent dehydrogenase (short-subunit alcohol dehydrogenase family)